MDASRLEQVLGERVTLRSPVRFPVVLRLDPQLGAERQVGRIARRGRIELAGVVPAARGAALRCTPELVPAAQRALVRQRLPLRDRDVAEAGADVDVALRAQRLQVLLDPFVLAERLDERADG